MAEKKVPSMRGAFEKLRNHYTPVNVIRYMDFVREQSLDVILENAHYIFVEPSMGAQTLRDIVSKSVLTESQTTALQGKLSKFVSNALEGNIKGGQLDKEHLEAVQECLSIVKDIGHSFVADDKAVLESTINNLHLQYLAPIMEAKSADKDIDKILYGIDKDPKLLDDYVSLLKKIQSAKTVTKIVNPVTLLTRNTMILIGTTVLVTGTVLTLIVSVPMLLVGAFMDGRLEKKYAKSYSHIIKGEIKKVEAAIPKADKDRQKSLKEYKDNLKQAAGKMDEIVKDDNKIVKAYKSAKDDTDEIVAAKEGLAEMHPVISYEDDQSAEGCEPEHDPLDLIHNEFAISMVNTFMDGDEDSDINLESFTEMIRIANKYDMALETASLTSVTEAGPITNGLRKVALGGEKVSRNIAHGARKIMTNRKHYTAPLNRIPQHIDNLVNSTIGRLKEMDKNERRNRIVEGGFKVKLFKLIRNAIVVGGVALINPAVAAIGLLASIAVDRKLDNNVRRQILDEMEDELKIVNEKIEDSKSYQDKEKKYQLMRIKNKLENDIQRIQYRLDRY